MNFFDVVAETVEFAAIVLAGIFVVAPLLLLAIVVHKIEVGLKWLGKSK